MDKCEFCDRKTNLGCYECGRAICDHHAHHAQLFYDRVEGVLVSTTICPDCALGATDYV